MKRSGSCGGGFYVLYGMGGEFGTQEGKDVWMCMGGLEFLV